MSLAEFAGWVATALFVAVMIAMALGAFWIDR